MSAVIWTQDEDKWFQNYKSHHFSSSLHSVWSLCRTERLIGAKCWIWTCSKALWCMPLSPLFPLLAFIKYLCKTQTCVLKTKLVPNGGNPSLLSRQKHLFTCHPIKHVRLQSSMKAESRNACVWWKVALWAFLRVKAENKAEQQLFHGRADLKHLFTPPSRHDAHWNVCVLLIWLLIKSRAEGLIMEVWALISHTEALPSEQRSSSLCCVTHTRHKHTTVHRWWPPEPTPVSVEMYYFFKDIY